MEKDLNYIYSYIKYIYFNVDELKDEKFLIDLSRKIKNSIPNSNFSEGNLNFYINNFINQEMRYRSSKSYADYFTLKNYVYYSVEYYRSFYSKKIENPDAVIREVMKSIADRHSMQAVLEGKCEGEIEELIELNIDAKFTPTETIARVPLDISHISFSGNSVVDSRTYIRRYILDHLKSMEGVFEFSGGLQTLSNLICDDMCRRSIKSDDVLAGEYDTDIDFYIRKKEFGIQFTDKFREVYIEVSRFVMNNHTYMDIGNMEQNMAEEIFKLSMDLIKSGYDKNSVQSGQCNTIMENHLRLDCLRANSLVCKNTKLEGKNPNKFFLDLRQIFENIKKPIILAVALGIVGTAVYYMPHDVSSSVSETQVFDTYDYPDIKYTTSEEFAETLEHVVDYYDDYEAHGEGYGQICLYRAFQSVNGNESEKTYAMDIMFAIIKARTKYCEDMQILYNDVLPYQSYMEYVYDSICNNPKMSDPKYRSAVLSYASQVANYKELKPWSLITKEEQKTIGDMLVLYGRYIDALEEEFNKTISNERGK